MAQGREGWGESLGRLADIHEMTQHMDELSSGSPGDRFASISSPVGVSSRDGCGYFQKFIRIFFFHTQKQSAL
jgi:hypothetical protein